MTRKEKEELFGKDDHGISDKKIIEILLENSKNSKDTECQTDNKSKNNDKKKSK